jgi:hypothetical protein
MRLKCPDSHSQIALVSTLTQDTTNIDTATMTPSRTSLDDRLVEAVLAQQEHVLLRFAGVFAVVSSRTRRWLDELQGRTLILRTFSHASRTFSSRRRA